MKNLLAQETRLPMYYVGSAHRERGSDLCVQSSFCLTMHVNKFLPPTPSVLLEVCCADAGVCAYFKCISALLASSMSGKV